MPQKPATASQAPARLRFAPGPAGHLNIDDARTALFNWLWARKLGGSLVVRIDDTDAQRSSEESLREVLDGLRWLGLHWDEGLEIGGPHGPYQRVLRQVLYHAEADRLLRQASAYRCFCGEEELQAMQAKDRAAGQSPRYDGRCRQLDPTASERRANAGEPCVVRLRLPAEGDAGWVDLVRGEQRVAQSTLDDFVVLAVDGSPTANFAAVVDDIKMRISHVIRSEDQIAATSQQLALFDALGCPPPEFAHLPRIVGPDDAHGWNESGAASIQAFRARGILPQAMVNALALLGWSPVGQRETFTLEELVARFDLRTVRREPVVFDVRKLEWVNHEHFARLPLGAKVEVLLPRLKAAGLWPPHFRVDLGPGRHFRVVTGGHDDKVAASIQPIPEEEWMQGEPTLAEELPRLSHILDVVGEELGGPHDAPEVLAYFYGDDFPYDADAVGKYLASEETAVRLTALGTELEAARLYTPETIEAAVRAVAARSGVEPGVVMHSARVAVTGAATGPDVFEVLYLVGRPKVLERLRRGGEIIRSNRAMPGAGTGAGGAGSPGPGRERGAPPPGETPAAAPPGAEPRGDSEFARGDAGGEEPPSSRT